MSGSYYYEKPYRCISIHDNSDGFCCVLNFIQVIFTCIDSFYVSLDLGFGTGKSKSLYGREGHLGITLVKFAGDQSGLKDAVRLAEYFEKDSRGRKVWARVQPLSLGKDDENNPSLVTVDQRTGEKKRILYGYLGTASDLDKVDFETRKKAVIESRREIKASK